MNAMRISLAATVLILIAGAALGLRDQKRLSLARELHAELTAEAEKLGVSLDLQSPDASGRVTKRERENGMAVAKDVAREFIAFAKEMEAAEKNGSARDEAGQKRVTEMLERIMALDSSQLKILIDEVRAATELKDEMRKGLIGFCIMTLATDHPQAALAIFTESSDLFKDDGMGSHVISSSLGTWAKDDPQAALEWVRKNAEKFPDLITDNAKKGLIAGAARQDPQLAFKLIAELGIKQPSEAVSGIMNAAQTAEERTLSLAALRAHVATLPEGEESKNSAGDAIRQLAINVVRDGFESATAWISTAKLSPAELEAFASGIHPSKRSESGMWVEWLGRELPPEKAENQISNLMRNWTQNDYQAAGTWLASAPDGPAKHASIRSYAETIASYDPEVASQWALTLPPGKARKQTLSRIHDNWPREDEAGKQAAKAFAKQHGIKD